jgi:hypothetical protein
MRLLYYIACIGNPDLDIKTEILISNLNYIYADIQCSFDVCINLYETDESAYAILHNILNEISFIHHCYVYIKKGVLTELFLTNPHNKFIENYDYIMFIMDDVKICDLQLREMIRIKELLGISVISPKIINSTYEYMNINTGTTINNFLEIYLVLLTPSDFNRFIGLYTIENRWMWGIDLLFGHFNVKAGLVNKFSAIHSLPSKCNHNDASDCIMTYINTHTQFKELGEIFQMYRAIAYQGDDMGENVKPITLQENIL